MKRIPNSSNVALTTPRAPISLNLRPSQRIVKDFLSLPRMIFPFLSHKRTSPFPCPRAFHVTHIPDRALPKPIFQQLLRLLRNSNNPRRSKRLRDAQPSLERLALASQSRQNLRRTIFDYRISISSAISVRTRMHTNGSKVRTKPTISCLAPCARFQSMTSAWHTSPSSSTSIAITTQDTAQLHVAMQCRLHQVLYIQHTAHGLALFLQWPILKQWPLCTNIARTRFRPSTSLRPSAFRFVCTILVQRLVQNFRTHVPRLVPAISLRLLPTHTSLFFYLFPDHFAGGKAYGYETFKAFFAFCG